MIKPATGMLIAFLVGVAAGGAAPAPGVPAAPRVVGVLVDQTRGTDARPLAAARARVARLEADGARAELRVVRSPSEAVAAASTLVALGAERIVGYGVEPVLLPASLRAHVVPAPTR